MTTCYDSINPLYNNLFKLVLNRDSDQFELMVQKVNLPGIGISDQPQPTIFGTTIPIPTMAAAFDPLSVEFIVDSQLENWKKIYAWIRQLANISNDDEHNICYQKWHNSSATLKIFKQDYKYPVQATIDCPDPVLCTITFENLIPISLSGLNFQSDTTDLMIQKATCRFKYSYYTIDPDPGSYTPSGSICT